MFKSTSFRPNLNSMEDRSMMSATFAALPEPVEMSAGKVHYSNLSAAQTETAQTREHILLARQIAVPSATDDSEGVSGLYRNILGRPADATNAVELDDQQYIVSQDSDETGAASRWSRVKNNNSHEV